MRYASICRSFCKFLSEECTQRGTVPLFAAWSPRGPKGCSMGAERVIKGCSARDQSNHTTRNSFYGLKNVLKNIFYLHMSKKCCIFATDFGIELKKHET